MKQAKALLLLILLTAFGLATRAEAPAGSPVALHGALSVRGTHIVDSHGRVVQLAGVSFGWHNYWQRFYNSGSISRLASDWKAEVVRAAIGLDLDSLCFDRRPERGYRAVDSLVRAAEREGLYVLIDFHSHKNNLPLAQQFFDRVAKQYGHLPNVIFEIWNEPTEVAWQEIKDYAEQLIPTIRRHAPKSIIVVPTPRWDQDVDIAARSPLDARKYGPIAYALHFYAATHKDYFREKAEKAIQAGLPLMITECAAMEHTGDGVIDPASWQAWMDFANRHQLSYLGYSLSDKVETCSMLTPGAPSDGSLWTEKHIKPWALMLRHNLQTRK